MNCFHILELNLPEISTSIALKNFHQHPGSLGWNALKFFGNNGKPVYASICSTPKMFIILTKVRIPFHTITASSVWCCPMPDRAEGLLRKRMTNDLNFCLVPVQLQVPTNRPTDRSTTESLSGWLSIGWKIPYAASE